MKLKFNLNKLGKTKILSVIFICLLALFSAYSVFGATDITDKECSDFVETADGKYFCLDDSKVYSCDSDPAVDGLSEKCLNSEYEGSLDKFNLMYKQKTYQSGDRFLTTYNLKNLESKSVDNFDVAWGEQKGNLINKKIIWIYEEDIFDCTYEEQEVWSDENQTYEKEIVQDCSNFIGTKTVEKRVTESEANNIISKLAPDESFNYRIEAEFDVKTCEVVERFGFYDLVHCIADPVISFGSYSYPEWDVWEQYAAVWSGSFVDTEEDGNGNLTLLSSNTYGTFTSNGFSGSGVIDCTSTGCQWDAIDWAGDDITNMIKEVSKFNESFFKPYIGSGNTQTGKRGITITVHKDMIIPNVTKASNEDGDTVYLEYRNDSVIRQATFVGATAHFTPPYIILEAGESYWIRIKNANNSSGTRAIAINDAPLLPINGTDFDIPCAIDNIENEYCTSIYAYYSVANFSYITQGDSYVTLDVEFSEDNSTWSDKQTNVTSGTDLGNDTAKYARWNANFYNTNGVGTDAKVGSVNMTYSETTGGGDPPSTTDPRFYFNGTVSITSVMLLSENSTEVNCTTSLKGGLLNSATKLHFCDGTNWKEVQFV